MICDVYFQISITVLYLSTMNALYDTCRAFFIFQSNSRPADGFGKLEFLEFGEMGHHGSNKRKRYRVGHWFQFNHQNDRMQTAQREN